MSDLIHGGRDYELKLIFDAIKTEIDEANLSIFKRSAKMLNLKYDLARIIKDDCNPLNKFTRVMTDTSILKHELQGEFISVLHFVVFTSAAESLITRSSMSWRSSSSQQTYGDDVFSMSGRNPWMFLIAKGYKKVENRHAGFADSKLNQPVAVHVSKSQYAKAERHTYYGLPLVQRYLAQDEQTKPFHADFEKLDAFFAEMCGSIIAVVFFSMTVRDNDDARCRYEFFDVPKRTAFHWIINRRLLLPEPIENYSGGLGIRTMMDASTKAAIKRFLM